MAAWLILITSVVLAVSVSSWWWVVVAFSALWKTSRYLLLGSRPWRKVHFPAMRAYARAAGVAGVAAERRGEQFSVYEALILFVQDFLGIGVEAAGKFVEIQLARGFSSEDDHDRIRPLLERRRPKPAPDAIDTALEKMENLFDSDDNGVKVRLVIAGIVEGRYSEADRTEYLLAVALGDAR